MPSLRNDEWREWLEYAEEDREEAHDRFNHGKWREACYHAQQSIEKLLKALTLKSGVFIPTHDIVSLLKYIEDKYGVKVLNVVVVEKELRELTIHYYASRYPNAGRRFKIKYDKKTAEKCIEVMEKIWRRVEKLC